MESPQQRNITHLSQEELEQKLKETQELYKKLNQQLTDDASSGWQLKDNLYFVKNQLNELEVEQIRRDQNLSLKEIPELEEIVNEAYRKIRHMENYDWDVVEDSTEENIQGFLNEIYYLEKLQTAANQEIDWKQRRLRT